MRRGTDGDAKGDLFQKAEADLAKGTAAIVPIDDIDHIGFGRDLPDGVQDDEVGWEAAFEFIMVLFMEIGIVDIEISEPGMEAIGKIVKEVGDIRADEVGTFGPDIIAEEVMDHSVEFPVIDGCPEGIFGARVEAGEEKIKIAPEMIGQGQEP